MISGCNLENFLSPFLRSVFFSPWHFIVPVTFDFWDLSRALFQCHGHFFENCHGLDQKCHGHFFWNCHGQIWNVTGILKKTCHGHFTVCHGHFFVLISFFFYLELSHHRWYLESHLSQVYYFQLKKHVIKPQFPEQKSLLLYIFFRNSRLLQFKYPSW